MWRCYIDLILEQIVASEGAIWREFHSSCKGKGRLFPVGPNCTAMRPLLLVTLVFGFLGAARSQSLLVEAGKETDVRIIKPSAKLKSWFSKGTQSTGNQACPSGAYCNAQYRKCMPCSTCQQNSDSIDGRCPQDKCSAVSSSQNDNVPPELVWLFIYPNSISITSGKVFVSAYLYVRDSGAGLRGAAMYVESSTLTGSSHGT